MRIRRLVAAGAAAAALTLGAALPAFADGSQEDAGTPKAGRAKVELYKRAEFKGGHATFTRSVSNLPAHGWDYIGSTKNLGKRTVVFYQHSNYGGARFSLAPGEKLAHMGDTGMSSPGAFHFR